MRYKRIGAVAAVVGLWLQAALGGEPQWKGAVPNDAGTFRFVIMGDNTGGHVPGLWDAAVAQVNLLKPDFVMSVGDLIEGYTTNSVQVAAMWDEFDAMTAKLQAPFYFCVGNHDITYDTMREEWLARYGVEGRTYYSFSTGGCHFVVLDISGGPSITTFDAQIEWLKSDLAEARDAAHVFLFYHMPLWMNADVWPRLAGLLDPARTTIFNGHWHALSYGVQDGIPTYVLPATGAEVGTTNRELGSVQVLTHVTVHGGKPTVAILPVGEVLPGDYVNREFADAFRRTMGGGMPAAVPATGGEFVLSFSNALSTSVEASVTWPAGPWTAEPPAAAATIPPLEQVRLAFTLSPGNATAARPSCSLTCAAMSPAGRRVSSTRTLPVGVFNELTIPTLATATVDGDGSEWKGVEGLRIAGSNCVWSGVQSWTGDADLAATVKAACQGDRLFVVVDVTDDQIATDAANVWDNDAVEFFWDARPANLQNGQPGEGTGQVMLGVPSAGGVPKPEWAMGKRRIPEGLDIAIVRRAGGYICELSLPLSELGCRLPLSDGDGINIEVQIDDRDIMSGGRAAVSHASSSGVPNSYQNTRCYARGTIKR